MITVRMGGLSIQCDNCGAGGFYRSHDEDKCLEVLGLKNKRLYGLGLKHQRCIGGCQVEEDNDA